MSGELVEEIFRRLQFPQGFLDGNLPRRYCADEDRIRTVDDRLASLQRVDLAVTGGATEELEQTFGALEQGLGRIEFFKARKPAGIILSGGPASVYADEAPHMDPAVLELGIPVLGFCYGIQEMALHLGGEIPKTDIGEYGFALF